MIGADPEYLAFVEGCLARVTVALEDVLSLLPDNPHPTGEQMGQIIFVSEERREAWKAALGDPA